MKNIILIVSLLLMGVTSRADILNSSDNKNVAEKFDPMLKAALFQMKIIADTSSILLSDIDYVEDLELKTSLWINNDVNRAKTTRHEITSLKGLEYFSSLRRLKLVGNRTDMDCMIVKTKQMFLLRLMTDMKLIISMVVQNPNLRNMTMPKVELQFLMFQ